jgi:putative ABC transport system ATP-binding protein
MPLLEAKNLTKTFTMGINQIEVLKGISLTIQSGEFMAITGYSGSGKSTLMHLLGCLDTPTTGSLFIEGKDVALATRDELAHIRNQKIGFVFQKFYLLPDLTALDNVALPSLYAGTSEAEALKEAAKLLDLVNLQDRKDHFPYQLSGGQQQRVAIARALVNNPLLILADEPTGNLDVATGEVILELFKSLNEQHHTTVIVVTHEPRIAAKTNRVVEVRDGLIVKDGKP